MLSSARPLARSPEGGGKKIKAATRLRSPVTRQRRCCSNPCSPIRLPPRSCDHLSRGSAVVVPIHVPPFVCLLDLVTTSPETLHVTSHGLEADITLAVLVPQFALAAGLVRAT